MLDFFQTIFYKIAILFTTSVIAITGFIIPANNNQEAPFSPSLISVEDKKERDVPGAIKENQKITDKKVLKNDNSSLPSMAKSSNKEIVVQPTTIKNNNQNNIASQLSEQNNQQNNSFVTTPINTLTDAIEQKIAEQTKEVQQPTEELEASSPIAQAQQSTVSPPNNQSILKISLCDYCGNPINSVLQGTTHTPIGSFIISNPLSEKVSMSEIKISLSDFAKNISRLYMEFEYPINEFGYSKKFNIAPSSPSLSGYIEAPCKNIGKGNGVWEFNCDNFNINQFKDIVFSPSQEVYIQPNQSIKLIVKVDVNNIPLSGEYGDVATINSCTATSLNSETILHCNPLDIKSNNKINIVSY